jgi:polyhydroxyalkanoate synthesis regulator phasin
METIKDIMYAGLGLVKQGEDKIKDRFDLLVMKGKKIDSEGNNLITDFFKTVGEMKESTSEKYNEVLKENITKVEDYLQKLKK